MPKPPQLTPDGTAAAPADDRWGAACPVTPARRVGEPLAVELAAAAEVVVGRLLDALVGRVYSPRVKLLDIRQVCRCTGLGKTKIGEMVRAGTFPQPQRNIGKQMWRESALIAWADNNDPNTED